jgi:hypothetical protein
LVDALRKHYATLHAAHLLKDGRAQLTLGAVDKLQTMVYLPVNDFERMINNPPKDKPGPSAVDLQDGHQGAIAKLHEIADGMKEGDMGINIPSVILIAAGFSETANAELDYDGEVIVRTPKKLPPRFMSLLDLEKLIFDQANLAEQSTQPRSDAKKELAHA